MANPKKAPRVSRVATRPAAGQQALLDPTSLLLPGRSAAHLLPRRLLNQPIPGLGRKVLQEQVRTRRLFTTV